MRETMRLAVAIAAKDIKIEFRTRTALFAALSFAILILAVLYVARDPTVVSGVDIAPGALWITFTFSAVVAMNRGFALEQDNGAMDALILTVGSPSAIFLGKMLGNLVFVVIVEAVTFPLFALFYDVPVMPRLPMLVVVTAMATVAFVSVGTLMSSMVIHTRFAELMLPILLLPFLVPPVVAAVQLTTRVLAERPLSELMGWLRLLAAFDLVFCVLPVLLFEATLDR